MLTINEAKTKLGISRAALYYAMAAGKLKYVEKYGKRLLDERSVAGYNPRNYRSASLPSTPQTAQAEKGLPLT